ncbi:hypothetical protein GC387_35205, partial [Pseudomonas sp. MWU12-2323]|nr:hypothetical protein [Pseudomonas sp. MWU12-2323]
CDHFHDLQLEAVVECPALVGHEKLLDRCIFHLSGCPGKLNHHIRPLLHTHALVFDLHASHSLLSIHQYLSATFAHR